MFVVGNVNLNREVQTIVDAPYAVRAQPIPNALAVC